MRNQVRTWVAACAAVCLLAGTAVGLSAQPAAQAPASSASAGQAAPNPQDQFVPVKTISQPESLPAPALVMTAYAFIWVVLLIYVWTVWRRLLKVESEIRALAARMGDRGNRA
jgi:CcmD family protein